MILVVVAVVVVFAFRFSTDRRGAHPYQMVSKQYVGQVGLISRTLAQIMLCKQTGPDRETDGRTDRVMPRPMGNGQWAERAEAVQKPNRNPA